MPIPTKPSPSSRSPGVLSWEMREYGAFVDPDRARFNDEMRFVRETIGNLRANEADAQKYRAKECGLARDGLRQAMRAIEDEQVPEIRKLAAKELREARASIGRLCKR